MPRDFSIWKLRKRRDKNNRLYWKNYMYSSLERRKEGSGGDQWRSLQYQWPVVHDRYDTVTPAYIAKNAKLNDWIIVIDVVPGKSITHYVPADLLTDTGTLYRHDGERWRAIVYRSSMKKKAVRDVAKMPGHLAWITGEKDDLLLAGFSPRTKDEAHDLLDEKYPFYYKYIRGAEVEDCLHYYDTWRMKFEGIVDERDEEETKGFRERAEKRQQADDKLYDIIKLIKEDPDWCNRYDDQTGWFTKRDIVKEGLKFFFEEGVPSSTAGTAAPTTVINAIRDLAGSPDPVTQMSQSGHEALAVLFATGLDAYRLWKLLDDDETDPGEVKTLGTNLVANFLKGGPAATTFFTVLAEAIKWAPRGLEATGEAMPFVGVVISLFESARNLRKSDHAYRRVAIFRELLSKIDPTSDDDAAKLTLLLRFAKGKANRKGIRLYATAAMGGVGAVGGTVLAVVAVTGAANAWNPVGWAIGGVALVGGIGITGYVIYRKATKKERHKQRSATKNRPVDAEDFAKKLIDFYKSKGTTGKYVREAEEILHALGVYAENGQLGIEGNPEKQRKIAITRIVRHFS
jgi:hypothetical protein